MNPTIHWNMCSLRRSGYVEDSLCPSLVPLRHLCVSCISSFCPHPLRLRRLNTHLVSPPCLSSGYVLVLELPLRCHFLVTRVCILLRVGTIVFELGPIAASRISMYVHISPESSFATNWFLNTLSAQLLDRITQLFDRKALSLSSRSLSLSFSLSLSLSRLFSAGPATPPCSSS